MIMHNILTIQIVMENIDNDLIEETVKFMDCIHKINSTKIDIIDDKDFVNDFYLLTLCEHCIIGNSSFSWWAAYLNNYPNKIIVAPVPYAFDIKRKIEDTYPSDWVLINRIEENTVPDYESNNAYY